MEVTYFPRPKKAQQSHSKIKTMITVFFDWEGVVLHEYTIPSQTINKKYYLSVLIRWEMQYWWKRPMATGDWQLHHDNVPARASHLVQSILVKHQITQVTQSHYSPDLAPCDFRIFPKLKSPLKGKRFQTIDEILENTMGQLMAIPIKDFVESFKQWKRCWENCVRFQDAYFEGYRGIVVLCTMFLVSCTAFNKCLYFSYYVAEYLPDRPVN